MHRHLDMAVKLTHLQLIYGVAGAREKFEELTVQLLHSQYPDVERIRIIRGDGGIDAHQGALTDTNGIDVFQIKFFPDGIGDSQQKQIRESFKRICDNNAFKSKSWTLCLPVDMSTNEKKWFDEWKQKQATTGIDIRSPLGALELESLLYEDKNRGIKESFFKEEYLQQIREIHTTLEQLARDFDERLPKPVALVLLPFLEEVRARRSYEYDTNHIVIEVQLCFSVKNVSSKSVTNWTVVCNINLSQEVCLTKKTFPKIGSGDSYIRLNSTILPTQSLNTEILYGLKVKRNEPLGKQIHRLLEPAQVTFHAISDNHVGEKFSVLLQEKINWVQLLDGIKESLRKENIRLSNEDQ